MVDESREHTGGREKKTAGQRSKRRRRMSDGFRKYYPWAELGMIAAFVVILVINYAIAALVWSLIP